MNRKRAVDQIKRLETSKAALLRSDSEDSVNMPCKKKARAYVLTEFIHQGKKTSNHHGTQRYFVMSNIAGIS